MSMALEGDLSAKILLNSTEFAFRSAGILHVSLDHFLEHRYGPNHKGHTTRDRRFPVQRAIMYQGCLHLLRTATQKSGCPLRVPWRNLAETLDFLTG